MVSCVYLNMRLIEKVFVYIPSCKIHEAQPHIINIILEYSAVFKLFSLMLQHMILFSSFFQAQLTIILIFTTYSILGFRNFQYIRFIFQILVNKKLA